MMIYEVIGIVLLVILSALFVIDIIVSAREMARGDDEMRLCNDLVRQIRDKAHGHH